MTVQALQDLATRLQDNTVNAIRYERYAHKDFANAIDRRPPPSACDLDYHR